MKESAGGFVENYHGRKQFGNKTVFRLKYFLQKGRLFVQLNVDHVLPPHLCAERPPAQSLPEGFHRGEPIVISETFVYVDHTYAHLSSDKTISD